MGTVMFSSRDMSAGTASSNPSSSIPLNTSHLLLRFSLPLSLLALTAALGPHRKENEEENEEGKLKRIDEMGAAIMKKKKPRQPLQTKQNRRGHQGYMRPHTATIHSVFSLGVQCSIQCLRNGIYIIGNLYISFD